MPGDRNEIDARMHRAQQATLRPLDTSELGPVRVHPLAVNDRAARAVALLDRRLPTIAGIDARVARQRIVSAMLEFEAAEAKARDQFVHRSGYVETVPTSAHEE